MQTDQIKNNLFIRKSFPRNKPEKILPVLPFKSPFSYCLLHPFPENPGETLSPALAGFPAYLLKHPSQAVIQLFPRLKTAFRQGRLSVPDFAFQQFQNLRQLLQQPDAPH